MTEDLMTIREMCDLFGVTPRTLRFYESRELIAPRRAGQRRLYSRRDRARLTLILRGKRFGFSLEEIRKLLDLYRRDGDGAVQLSESVRAAERQLADLEARRAELDQVIDELRAQLDWARGMLAGLHSRTAAE